MERKLRRSPGEKFVNSKFSERYRFGRALRHIFVADNDLVSLQDQQATGQPVMGEATVRRFLVFGRKESVPTTGYLPFEEK